MAFPVTILFIQRGRRAGGCEPLPHRCLLTWPRAALAAEPTLPDTSPGAPWLPSPSALQLTKLCSFPQHIPSPGTGPWQLG